MASFNHISGQEPSTVTFKAATVTMTRNSSVMHQELISLADPESSLSIARVSSAAPNSTDAGLIVRQVGFDSNVTIRGNSTAVISAFAAGLISSAASAANSSALLVRVVGGPSSAADFPVQISGNSSVVVTAMPANSSLVSVTAFPAGMVSSAAPASNDTGVFVRQVGPIAISSVSSIAGVVTVSPNSTGWIKNAGLSVDSSNYLNVNASFTGSTDVSISKLPAGLLSSAAPAGNSSALLVRLVGGPSSAGDAAFTVHGNQSSNSSVYLPVRLTNGTGFLAAASDYLDGSTASSIAGPTLMFDNGTNATMRHVSLTAGLPVNIVAGSASGPTSTAAPATNDTGLVVRQVGYSTIVTVAAMPANSSLVSLTQIAAGYLSSAAAAGNSSALLVRVVGGPSSATDFQTRIAGPTSTTWASSAGFHFDSSGALQTVASFSGSTGPLTVTQLLTSSNEAVQVGDLANQALRVNVVAGAAGGSTIVSVAALPAGMISSAAPAANDTGLFVRQIGYSTVVSVAAMPANSSIVAVGSFAAGLISSAAPAAGSSGLVVWPVGYSTIVSVAALPANSSQVEVRAMPANSSVVAIGSIAAGLISSGAPVHGSSALMVRQVVSSLQSTTVTILSSNSTALYTLLSSAAGRTRVYGYFAGAGANASPSTVLIGDSTTPGRFAIVMSSGAWGANMAVSPPGFLFEAAAGNAIQVRIESASTAISVRFGLSYFID